jgi:peptidoglycan/LPS O-acetylase OafA/YrhL
MERYKELDVLRGLAALSVVLYHYTTRVNLSLEYGIFTKFHFEYGYLGVELFFIISGFVIFLTIDKSKSPKEFIIKRFSRLYPTYWICLTLTFLITSLAGVANFQRRPFEAVIGFTMLQGFLEKLGIRSIDGVYWSLLPELIFYFLMLILMIFRKIDKVVMFGTLWLIAMLICSFMEGHVINGIKFFLNLNFGMLFFVGILFYKMKHDEKARRSYKYYILILITYILYAISRRTFVDIVAVGFIYLIFILFVFSKLSWIINNQLVLLGEISYSLYLLHQFIGYIIMHYLVINNIRFQGLILGIPLSITIVLAFLVTKYLERPAITFIRQKYLRPKVLKLGV